MTQLIKLTAKASKAELEGRKGEVLTTLKSLGAGKSGVELADAQKKLKKMKPGVVRSHVRKLRDEKFLTVKRVKAEKAA